MIVCLVQMPAGVGGQSGVGIGGQSGAFGRRAVPEDAHTHTHTHTYTYIGKRRVGAGTRAEAGGGR